MSTGHQILFSNLVIIGLKGIYPYYEPTLNKKTDSILIWGVWIYTIATRLFGFFDGRGEMTA